MRMEDLIHSKAYVIVSDSLRGFGHFAVKEMQEGMLDFDLEGFVSDDYTDER